MGILQTSLAVTRVSQVIGRKMSISQEKRGI